VAPPGRDPLTTALALIISVVWATIALASIVIREYAALTIVTPVMLVVAGFLFGLRVTKNGDVGKD
jgi:hypothetical protein